VEGVLSVSVSHDHPVMREVCNGVPDVLSVTGQEEFLEHLGPDSLVLCLTHMTIIPAWVQIA
jgi:hypothetical protein